MGKRNDRVFRLTRIASRVLLSPFFRLETEGRENLPRNHAFVLLPKHQRWEDIPLLGLAAPRPLYYVAKHELFLNPFSNWFLRSLGGIPLNRRRPLESRVSLQALVAFLKDGEGVAVFPEGTYYKNKMGPGHVGVVRLILSRLNLPIIPVGVNYSARRTRTVVRINFGKPFYADPAVSARSFLEIVMKEIAALSGFE